MFVILGWRDRDERNVDTKERFQNGNGGSHDVICTNGNCELTRKFRKQIIYIVGVN